MGEWVKWLANESHPYAAYRALNAGRMLGAKKPVPGVRPLELAEVDDDDALSQRSDQIKCQD